MMYWPFSRLGSILRPSTLKFWTVARTARKISRARRSVSTTSRKMVR
jgi:hypothetical protein